MNHAAMIRFGQGSACLAEKFIRGTATRKQCAVFGALYLSALVGGGKHFYDNVVTRQLRSLAEPSVIDPAKSP